MQVVIHANAPEALTKLCGISLLERLLRVLKRLKFYEATIVTSTPEEIRAAIEPPTWARRGLKTRIVSAAESMRDATLFLPGNFYFDQRLIHALASANVGTTLIDSEAEEKNSGASVLFKTGDEPVVLDAAKMPAYIVRLRREVRPRFFSAPKQDRAHAAEEIILDAARYGSPDLPSIVQAPVEDWVIRRLWCTSITPNQISLCGFFVALIATAFFAQGKLWWGMVPALAIGVIDGLDGKQARLKIETTETGKWEHYLDFVFETSWWAALAFWFHDWRSFFVIVIAEAIERLAKRAAKLRIARSLDDYTAFDRFVRLIGARRDIYIWILLVGLLFGAAAPAYRFCAIWGALTASVYTVRAVMIRWR